MYKKGSNWNGTITNYDISSKNCLQPFQKQAWKYVNGNYTNRNTERKILKKSSKKSMGQY